MGLWYGGNSPTELCGGSKCPVVDNPVFGHHVKNWGNNKIRVVSLRKCTILEDFDFKYFGFLSHIKMKQKLPQNCYKKDTLGVEIMELLTTYPLVI